MVASPRFLQTVLLCGTVVNSYHAKAQRKKEKGKNNAVIEKRSFLGGLGVLSEAGVRIRVSRKAAKALRNKLKR
jgi:hypothetical protein